MSHATALPPVSQDLRQRQELCGKVSAIRFFDEESGHVIVTLDGRKTVKGDFNGSLLESGERYRFYGRWMDDVRWGKQFVFDCYTADHGYEKTGTLRYLARTCRGIGVATAGKLWEAYAADCIEILRTDPRRVADDGVCDPTTANEAAADLAKLFGQERTTVELFGLFNGRGLGAKAIQACIGKWGVRAPELIRRNPWLLLLSEIPGAGFKRTDRLYLDLGGDPKKLKRQMLAGWNAMREGNDGHTWHPAGLFRSGIAKQVGMANYNGKALSLGIRAGWIRPCSSELSGALWLAEAQAAADEAELAAGLLRLMEPGPCHWPLVSPPAVSDHQAEKVAGLASSRLFLLLGTPGTGKTFVGAAILKEIVARLGHGCIAVAAPTGKAAVRISEAMARYSLPLEASTIHRLLKIGRNGHDGKGWGFTHNREEPLPYKFVVIDEASMLDTQLARCLVDALALGAHLLLIGDPYQLPPVGHGAPLRDMIAAGLPQALLTEIQRNSGAIVRACAAIKDGKPFVHHFKLDEEAGLNLRLIECEEEANQLDTLAKVITSIKASGKRCPVWDCQVLTPLNEKSGVSRVPLNRLLQGLLNPPGPAGEADQVGEFRRRDKIICIKNCLLQAQELTYKAAAQAVNSYRPARDANWQTRQVFLANGDQGEVLATDAAARTIIAKFTGPVRIVKIPLGKKNPSEDGAGEGAAKDFTLAYAITGHKSQGSEWPLVIVMIDAAAGQVASREWVYTAISRAKNDCLLIGKRGVIDRHCSRVTLAKRKTFLKELLLEGV